MRVCLALFQIAGSHAEWKLPNLDVLAFEVIIHCLCFPSEHPTFNDCARHIEHHFEKFVVGEDLADARDVAGEIKGILPLKGAREVWPLYQICCRV